MILEINQDQSKMKEVDSLKDALYENLSYLSKISDIDINKIGIYDNQNYLNDSTNDFNHQIMRYSNCRNQQSNGCNSYSNTQMYQTNNQPIYHHQKFILSTKIILKILKILIINIIQIETTNQLFVKLIHKRIVHTINNQTFIKQIIILNKI